MLCWPRGPSSRGSNASSKKHNSDSTELEIKIATQPLWAPHASESTGKGAVTLARVNDPYDQGETALQFHNGRREEDIWNTGDALRCLLVLPGCVITVH